MIQSFHLLSAVSSINTNSACLSPTYPLFNICDQLLTTVSISIPKAYIETDLLTIQATNTVKLRIESALCDPLCGTYRIKMKMTKGRNMIIQVWSIKNSDLVWVPQRTVGLSASGYILYGAKCLNLVQNQDDINVCKYWFQSTLSVGVVILQLPRAYLWCYQ